MTTNGGDQRTWIINIPFQETDGEITPLCEDATLEKETLENVTVKDVHLYTEVDIANESKVTLLINEEEHHYFFTTEEREQLHSFMRSIPEGTTKHYSLTIPIPEEGPSGDIPTKEEKNKKQKKSLHLARWLIGLLLIIFLWGIFKIISEPSPTSTEKPPSNSSKDTTAYIEIEKDVPEDNTMPPQAPPTPKEVLPRIIYGEITIDLRWEINPETGAKRPHRKKEGGVKFESGFTGSEVQVEKVDLQWNPTVSSTVDLKIDGKISTWIVSLSQEELKEVQHRIFSLPESKFDTFTLPLTRKSKD